jgi:hypothetical protein
LAGAERSGVTLRLLGSIGCRLHCAGLEAVFDRLQREDPPDLDFAAPGKHRKSIREVFVGLGYVEDRDMTVAMEGRRYKFVHPVRRLNVDLFIDRLEFCHPIDVAKRFGLDSPTLPLSDLVLSKLQIVEINQKDLKDLAVLLLAHEVGGNDPERLDASRVSRLASEDWGLFYTMSRNVERLRGFLDQAPLTPEEHAQILSRLDGLWAAVETEPKSLRWKVRAKVGPRVQWYEDVAEPEPTF